MRPTQRRANAWLVDTRTQRSYQLFEGDTTIGRGTQNDIVLTDESISRTHAMIRFQSRVCLLYDTGAAVPMQVNGHRVEGCVDLMHDDMVTIGETIFRLVLGII